jgi:hypothetical protein
VIAISCHSRFGHHECYLTKALGGTRIADGRHSDRHASPSPFEEPYSCLERAVKISIMRTRGPAATPRETEKLLGRGLNMQEADR